MSEKRIALINAYRAKIKAANKELTKKEAFKDLLNRLYSGEKEIEKIIDAISAGAEKTVLNIPRTDRLHKGSADTLYNKIIIEFENDLRKMLPHAKEQLAGYLLGEFRTGKGYNFTLIVSDFINWKVFSPDVQQLDKLETLKEHELKLVEVESASFTLKEDNADDFYFWLDRFLFREEKQRATLKGIEEAFGYRSATFIECFRQISNVFQDAKKYGEVQVSYEQWRKFLSIAYGSFADTENAFVIHTYLSVLAKVLAYEVLSNDDYVDDKEMKGILDGSIFHKYNIRNFVDNDFFHWVHKERYFHPLKKTFRLIAQEISAFDFEKVDEDVLKGVYQDLIDLDTRHALGEYYTPDWLCERVVQEFEFKPSDRILDPSCGSGSFLRAAIHRLKELNPKITAEQINACIYGIDIHPLSVQIAKTTMLVALGKDILKAKDRVKINIILANTLLAPDGVQDLFGSNFKMSIDKDKLILTSQILDDVTLFDQGVEVCEEVAEQTQNKKKIDIKSLENSLRLKHRNGGINQQIVESFYKIYESFKGVKERGRDSIWKFIVQNLYKPYFLSGKFNYIIGNPPWFTYSSIKNEEYQDILNDLAEKYEVKPARVANYPHLEIAAIFLSYCTNYYLRENGKLAFVLPRSFWSADHHDNTRNGKAKGFRIINAWDLNNVYPLFRVPSGVLFAQKVGYGYPKKISGGIQGKAFDGKVPYHNCNWELAKPKLNEEKVTWHYIKQGNSSAYSTTKTKTVNAVNPYKKLFKQGATIVPRNFYFVDVDMAYDKGWEKGFDWKDRIINLKTSNGILPDAKPPWKNHLFNGFMESRYIFRTALSKSILPFALYKPDLVVLPLVIKENKQGEKTIELKTPQQLSYDGYGDAQKWFKKADLLWSQLSTEKSSKMSANDRLNYQRGLTEQNLNANYLVLYNSSAKDANATIIKRKDLDLEFLTDHKTYCFHTNKLNEAYYITSILNSNVPNFLMKDFQSRGLFGARDVHKKILDVYFPKFDDKNEVHLKLAELSKDAHTKATAYIKSNPPKQELTAIHLGRLRSDIKKHLAAEIKEIDKLVKKIVG